jgi:predicted lipoprotein with Yx(FWY)xxD motif
MRSPNRSGLALAAAMITALALAIVAAGCGGDDNNGSNAGGGDSVYGGGGSTTSTTASSGGGAAVISVADNPKLGEILVDSKGITLYYFLKDKQGGTSSTCSGACASVWPPVTSSGAPKGEKGAQASKLGTIDRSDGSTEVTYNGWPLYTYVGDKKPGDTNGNDLEQFGAEWYALTPAGNKPED